MLLASLVLLLLSPGLAGPYHISAIGIRIFVTSPIFLKKMDRIRIYQRSRRLRRDGKSVLQRVLMHNIQANEKLWPCRVCSAGALIARSQKAVDQLRSDRRGR